MSHEKSARRVQAGGAVATGLAAVLIPLVSAAQASAASDDFSGVAAALFGDSAADSTAATQGFDISGLLQAEASAGEALLNSIVDLPINLAKDVGGAISSAVTDSTDLNYGDAFSALAGIPPTVVGALLGTAIGVPSGLYGMAFEIPGQFLFNFGDDATSGSAAAIADLTGLA